jgi:uncharacterized linocin/CFP29 family protein
METEANLSSPVGWTDAQWRRVYQAVSEEASKASVAGAFLPCFGPLSRSAYVVSFEELQEEDQLLTVSDDEPIKLWTLAVYVELKQQQLADENLSAALASFRRAANLLARAEDAIVFNGLPYKDPDQATRDARKIPKQCRVTGGEKTRGLVTRGKYKLVAGINDYLEVSVGYITHTGRTLPYIPEPSAIAFTKRQYFGQAIVQAVSQAMTNLDQAGHLGPYACVLGNWAFVQAHTPAMNSLVLPRDSIEPLLGGPVLRSGAMDEHDGIVISLAGDPIDLVVATAPTVQFLRVEGLDARYLFRVYERFALRVKESNTISAFTLVAG